MITIRERVYCKANGYRQLADNLEISRQLYNAMLCDRRDRWRYFRESVSHDQQSVALTRLRIIAPELAALDRQVAQEALRRLDKAFKAFFRRVKQGDEPGFPRFKPRNRWHGIGTENAKPHMLRHVGGERYNIRIKGLPLLRMKTRRDLPDNADLRKIMIRRDGRKLWASLTYRVSLPDVPDAPALPVALDCAVGIDMGVTERAKLSDGKSAARVRIDRHKQKRLQRRKARAKKGSKGYIHKRQDHARECAKIALRKRQAMHRETTRIVREYDYIAFEKLPIKNMTKSAKGTKENPGKNVSQKRGLNREILEQSWGEFQSQLAYKAEWAGKRTEKVKPHYTSQMCSACGVIDKSQRKKKIYDCKRCGLRLDADHNAAINVLHRALGPACVGIERRKALDAGRAAGYQSEPTGAR